MTLCGLVLLMLVSLWPNPGAADNTQVSSPGATEKRSALPMEMDYDYGADNGNALIMRLLPVHVAPLSENWRLVNVATLIIADAPGGVPGTPGNPSSVSGDNVFGLGDFVDALFLARAKENGLMWGVGPIISMPIASDERLGSGKWSAGPAIRLAYNTGPWHFGMLMGNFSSFAGESDRVDVNQLLIRGLIRRNLDKQWFFKYSPIITANWDAPVDQRWLVPLGGGIGKHTTLFNRPINFSVEAYANIIKPEGAPDSVFRLTFTLPF